MDQEKINEIISKFGEAWVNQDPDSIMNLIAKENLNYYESTFSDPVTSWDYVKKLWDVVPDNQENVTWWHEILISQGNKALAHVKVTRNLIPSSEFQDIDAAFLFGVNDKGEINYFRQWRMLA